MKVYYVFFPSYCYLLLYTPRSWENEIVNLCLSFLVLIDDLGHDHSDFLLDIRSETTVHCLWPKWGIYVEFRGQT
jgi:hypothetical protein